MANVSTHFSATVEDSFGVKASTAVYLDVVDTTTLAGLAAAIGTWLTDLDAITDGKIVANEIRITPLLPGGLKGSPVAGSYDARVGRIGFSATGTSKLWSQAVPAIAAGSISNGKIPNTGSMATYTALLLSGTPNYTNPGNQALTALAKTIVADNSKRKQQQGKTTTLF